MANIGDLLDGHVTLAVECIDRMYLNGWIPRLSHGGGLRWFLSEHLGKPLASPALLGQIRRRFVERLQQYAEQQHIPMVRFKSGERKDERAKEMRRQRAVRDEVVFIGVAQEKAMAFRAQLQQGSFEFSRDKAVCVNHYYFYLDDADFGPLFLKVCSYAPWGIKLCLNGHEWAKRQLAKQGVTFTVLDNGFLECDEPEALQAVCDWLGPADIERLLRKWLARLPLPLTAEDRQAGYDYQLSIWQLEVSLTQIFDRPLRGREFFEEVIRDNLDLGRPDRLQLVFQRQVRKNTPGPFRTRVIQDGVNPSLHVQYKQCQLKQYFKQGRGLRTETTFGNSKDFGVNKGLANLNYLQRLGRRINRRLLEVERVSHNCGLSADSIQRVVQPTVNQDGQKAPGLRFGQPRVMALFVALSLFQHLIDGFQNRDLRAQVAALLGLELRDYSATQMSYDLRRLRRKGLIFSRPGSRRYFLTPYGWKVARLFSRLEARVFRPAVVAFGDQPSVLPRPLRAALRKVDAELDQLVSAAFPLRKVA